MSKRSLVNPQNVRSALLAVAIFCGSVLPSTGFGQAPAAAARPVGAQGPQVLSPEVSSNRQVTFRIHASQAQAVRLSGGDIPGNNQGAAMTKDTNGVWEVALGP